MATCIRLPGSDDWQDTAAWTPSVPTDGDTAIVGPDIEDTIDQGMSDGSDLALLHIIGSKATIGSQGNPLILGTGSAGVGEIRVDTDRGQFNLDVAVLSKLNIWRCGTPMGSFFLRDGTVSKAYIQGRGGVQLGIQGNSVGPNIAEGNSDGGCEVLITDSAAITLWRHCVGMVNNYANVATLMAMLPHSYWNNLDGNFTSLVEVFTGALVKILNEDAMTLDDVLVAGENARLDFSDCWGATIGGDTRVFSKGFLNDENIRRNIVFGSPPIVAGGGRVAVASVSSEAGSKVSWGGGG